MKEFIFTDVPIEATPFLLQKNISKLTIDSLIIYICDNKVDPLKIKKWLDFLEINSLIIESPDVIPYELNFSSKKSVFLYFKSLNNLSNNLKNIKVIILTINTLIKKNLPKSIINKANIEIKCGKNLEQHILVQKLLHWGYEIKKTAYAIGDIAIKGNLVDIITPLEALRVDYFDNKIDNIRLFDINTQLTTAKIEQKCQIFPVKLLMYDYININSLNNFFKKKNLNITKSLNHNIRYPGEENWANIFYNVELQNFFKYLDKIEKDCLKKCVLIFDHINLTNINNSLSALYAQQKKNVEVEFSSAKELLYLDVQQDISKKFKNNIAFIATQDSFYHKTHKDHVVQKSEIIQNFLNHEQNLRETFASKSKQTKIILTFPSQGCLISVAKILNLKFNIIEKISQAKSEEINCSILHLNYGFNCQSEKYIFIALKNTLVKQQSTDYKLSSIYMHDIEIGDLVVHKKYGIGIFGGIIELFIDKQLKQHFYVIEYQNHDKIYTPVENVNLIFKYGTSNDTTVLDTIGSKNWQKRKENAKNRISLIADELIKTAAIRNRIKIDNIKINCESYKLFCDSFPYIETDDQLTVLQDIFTDLQNNKLIDRLICGDAGVGKTEVALRAAFIITDNNFNNQVALLSPTTVLANQHYKLFHNRMSEFGINVVELSSNTKNPKKIKEEIKTGIAQVVIGTTSLLKTEFANLKMLIIDEEQQFGVKDKEYIKKTYPKTHVISMSATPIPRTLQMSLSSIRDLSLITTFPKDRIIPCVFVSQYNLTIIKNFILREYKRGGSVLYICPRIKDIQYLYSDIADFCKEYNINTEVLHGKLKNQEIEDIMSRFRKRDTSVVLATNIVQSGIDISHTNTIIVYDSHKFGTSQLYQLRGRVGRSNVQSYVYFIKPDDITEAAEDRLNFIKSLNQMNCSFSVANYDMDFRGFGNLVGDKQSGKVKEVGIEMYQEMLNAAILNKPVIEEITVSINLNRGIPNEYIKDFKTRMQIYRKLSKAETKEEILQITSEMIDRFGEIPDVVDNLIKISLLITLSKHIGIKSITITKKYIYINFLRINIDAKNLILFIMKNNLKYKIIKKDEIKVVEYNESLEQSLKRAIEHIEIFSDILCRADQ
ncbi:DEAD/DEAH box helicase [Anaplasmataceae bacterium AB001_6]|nr:DEAD/DEAH box helicase [Anaplasmataceae bacterium AB001_6]